jgi:hypothetical protein
MHMSTIEIVAKANDMGSIPLIFLVMRRSAVVQYLLEARVVFSHNPLGANTCKIYPTNECFVRWIRVLD